MTLLVESVKKANRNPKMWNDEDNNPYGSFDRHNSNTSDVPNTGSDDARTWSAFEKKSGTWGLREFNAKN